MPMVRNAQQDNEIDEALGFGRAADEIVAKLGGPGVRTAVSLSDIKAKMVAYFRAQAAENGVLEIVTGQGGPVASIPIEEAVQTITQCRSLSELEGLEQDEWKGASAGSFAEFLESIGVDFNEDSRQEPPIRTAQDIRTKVTTVHFPVNDQVVVDGSLTKEFDNDFESVIAMDRKEVGSQYSPLYWAERIYQAMREFQSDPVAIYKVIIEGQAKPTGLSEGQETAIQRWLDSLGVPWSDNPKLEPYDLKPNTKSPGVQADTDSHIDFQQKYPGSNGENMKVASLGFPTQAIAANLAAEKRVIAGIEKMGRVLQAYSANKNEILTSYYANMAQQRIAVLQDTGFSYAEIVKDSANWSFPKEITTKVLAGLKPDQVPLSSLPPTLALSNGKRAATKRKSEQAMGLMAKKAKVPDTISTAQSLRLRRLASKHELSSPWWINAGTNPLQAMALMRNGRVLRVAVKLDGNYTQNCKFEKNLKTAIKDNDGDKDIGWVAYCTSQ